MPFRVVLGCWVSFVHERKRKARRFVSALLIGKKMTCNGTKKRKISSLRRFKHRRKEERSEK